MLKITPRLLHSLGKQTCLSLSYTYLPALIFFERQCHYVPEASSEPVIFLHSVFIGVSHHLWHKNGCLSILTLPTTHTEMGYLSAVIFLNVLFHNLFSSSRPCANCARVTAQIPLVSVFSTITKSMLYWKEAFVLLLVKDFLPSRFSSLSLKSWRSRTEGFPVLVSLCVHHEALAMTHWWVDRWQRDVNKLQTQLKWNNTT